MKNILIIGLGRFGRIAAATLTTRENQVLGVDKSEKRVNDALPFLTSAQIGDATDPQFLEALCVDNFDVCIVAIGDDFRASVEATALLKELGAPLVVSRASDDLHSRILKRSGADDIVYPEKQMAEWTAVCYSSEMISDYIPLTGGYAIMEVEIPENWNGKAVNELDIRRKYGINIIGMKTDHGMIPSISPDTVLRSEQHILVLGTNENISKCFKFDR